MSECIQTELLRNIERNTNKEIQIVEYGNYGDWSYAKSGNKYHYYMNHTYAGTTTDLTIPFKAETRIWKITQTWDDATAKDASIRLKMKPSSTVYTYLDSVTGDINTDKLFQGGLEYEYPPNTSLFFSYANYTAGKIVEINVFLEEV